MRTKRTIAALAILALSASLMLSGCSSSTSSADTSAASASENTSLSSGSVTVDIGGTSVTYNAAYLVDGTSAVITSGEYTSASSDQVVFLVINGGSLTISDATVSKTGDSSVGSSNAQTSGDVSDTYNFYGTNSAIVCVGEGSSVTINDVTLTTSASGANAVFATDSGTVAINGITITTDQDSSRGLDATYGGTITAADVTITTSGAHCAALATDRGGGTVEVTGASTLNTAGDGSPLIYSTGSITVTGASGSASGSEIAVIEGKNSATIADCSFTSSGSYGFLLYQSTSGDAADGDASGSVLALTISGSSLSAQGNGGLFYVTNTSSVIDLSQTQLSNSSASLITAGAGRWGNSGSNGGSLTLTATGETLSGTIAADSLSSVSLSLNGASVYSGTTSGAVNITADATSSAN